MNKEPNVASLIFFKPGVDIERVERWIKALEEKGVIDGSVTKEYDSTYGDPCWYIP